MISTNQSRNVCSFGGECWDPMVAAANEIILHQSLHIVIFMIVLILTGIPGNLLVIVVYMKQKKKTTALLFILCLAYVDLVTLCIVHPYVVFKIFNSSNQDWETLCKFFEFGIHASLSISVAVLYMVSIDRFVAICLPLKYFRYQTFAKYIMIGCCILGVTLSTPILLFYGKRPVLLEVDGQYLYGYICDYQEQYRYSTSAKIFGSIMFFMFIYICLCLIIFYTCVARKAYMSRRVRPATYMLEGFPQTSNTQISFVEIGRISSTRMTSCSSVLKNEKPLSIRLNGTSSSSENGRICSKGLNNITPVDVENMRTHSARLNSIIPNDDNWIVHSSRLKSNTTAFNKDRCRKLKHRTHLQKDNDKNKNRLVAARKVLPDKLKAAKILSLVTLVFILSWLPFWVLKVLSFKSKNETRESYYNNGFENFSNHLFYLNNAVNPLIYFILHKTFRKECIQMFKR